MTAGQRDSALGAGAIGFLLNNWIESRFDLPDPDITDLAAKAAVASDVDELSMSCATPARRLLKRNHQRNAVAFWGLGELPIKNMRCCGSCCLR